MWTFRCELWLNASWHMSHLHGFSPLRTRWCKIKSFSTNITFNDSNITFPQCLHASSALQLLCLWHLCCCIALDYRKVLLHTEHLYGFSPLCILLCLTRSLDFINCLLQTGHSDLTSRSSFNSSAVSLCTRYLHVGLCVCSELFWVNILSHSKHVYGLSPLCTLMWTFRVPDWLNTLSHTAYVVSLHCELYRVYQDHKMMWSVC